MQFNNTNSLMNTLMYDALKNAGVKEEDARAAATEAARSDFRSITLEYAINNLGSHVDKSMTELRREMAELGSHMDISMTKLLSHVDISMTKLHSHVDISMAELRSQFANDVIKVMQDNHNNANKNTNKLLIGIGVVGIMISVAIGVVGYFL